MCKTCKTMRATTVSLNERLLQLLSYQKATTTSIISFAVCHLYFTVRVTFCSFFPPENKPVLS